ncbi:unnamed protein product [Thlaspi arvense]|uniref:Acidic protein n=1 Tax=Thlaspi arvense TaxID=13288 RepID=A0AAU9RVK8_THLAR|nr:unnamed protein product [Thlaspi arvense]
MEDRTVILSVLIMTLVMAQTQVEAEVCCPNLNAGYNLISCLASGGYGEQCTAVCGCKYFSESSCPPEYPIDILGNSADAVNKYCKLGCAFSVCGAMTTFQNSNANEIWNAAAEQCTKACSTICNKGSLTAVKNA